MIRRLAILAVAILALSASALSAESSPPDPALTAKATEMLQALLRVDTTNPPGREMLAVELVASWLKKAGIEAKIYESAPGRGNLIARLKGTGQRAPLMLLSHVDVVLADAERWKHPPFSGRIVDGVIWGRGAVDMKSMTVMQALTMIDLKQRNVPLDRDIVLVATADEEAGGALGVGWLLKNHPDEMKAGECLNEGSFGTIGPDGTPIVGIQTAERGALWVRLTSKGRPGHGSVDRPDSATRKMVRALDRLERTPKELELGPEARDMFKTFGKTVPGIGGMVLGMIDFPFVLPLAAGGISRQNPSLAGALSTTFNATVLQAGSEVNVVPAEASAEIDIRVLPGHTAAEILERLAGILAEPDIAIDIIKAGEPSRSPPDGPLFRALADAAVEEYPGALVTQILTPSGSTDSGLLRPLGVRCYGLIPVVMSAQQLETAHGDDEHISIEQLGRGTRVVMRAVEKASSR